MRNFMYLRPGNMPKQFAIERCVQAVNAAGRPVTSYGPWDGETLKAVLCVASESEAARFSQESHHITHTIVQEGRARAKEDDRLRFGNRSYLIKGVDNCGLIGTHTIYYVEERMDLE